MADHAELRRLAEAAKALNDGWLRIELLDTYRDVDEIRPDPDDVLALLDAAERADRAIELLRNARAVQIIALHLTGETWTGAWCGDKADDPRLIARIDAFLAEVDRAG